jgi:hypothetical protein
LLLLLSLTEHIRLAMPIEIGLLSTQQDSFEHHEELSQLLNETDVSYHPLSIAMQERQSIECPLGFLCIIT